MVSFSQIMVLFCEYPYPPPSLPPDICAGANSKGPKRGMQSGSQSDADNSRGPEGGANTEKCKCGGRGEGDAATIGYSPDKGGT